MTSLSTARVDVNKMFHDRETTPPELHLRLQAAPRAVYWPAC